MLMKIKIFIICFLLALLLYIGLIIPHNQNTFKFSGFFYLYKNFSNQTEIKKNSSIPRVFCILLTTKEKLHTKAKSVYEIWANQCDNLKFISLLPEEFSTFNLSKNTSKPTFLELDRDFVKSWLAPHGLEKDTYKNLTNKVFLAYKHIHKYHSDYEWYLKADDDTFIFVNNLRKFLIDKNSSSAVTYGFDFNVNVDGGFHSGGGGYLMSNEAFRRIGSKLNEDFRFCPNSGIEDVDVAKCFRKLQVFLKKSIDQNGRERFHPLNIDSHFFGHFPEYMLRYAANPLKKVKYWQH